MFEEDYSYCKYIPSKNKKNIKNFCEHLFTTVSKKDPSDLYTLNHYTVNISEISDTSLYVDSFDIPNVNNILFKYNLFFKYNLKPASVVVWDLDNTIIDKNYNLINDQLVEILSNQKNIFDYTVLWSHGNTTHVEKGKDLLNRKYDIMFDLCISKRINDFDKPDTCKNISYVLKLLNKKYHITSFKFSCLIDDICENYNKDYFAYIKPSKSKNYIDLFYNTIPSIIKKGPILNPIIL